MKTYRRRVRRRPTARGPAIAVLSVALLATYATDVALTPPRHGSAEYAQVAEIIEASSTVGMSDSALIYMSQADVEKNLDQMNAMGVKNIRILVPWAVIEQSDDVFTWSQMDMVMSAAAARNLGVLANINSTPLWAAPPYTYPGAGTPPPAQFAEFLQQVINRYGNAISAYEIWNEPNFVLFYQPIDPASYATLLQTAYSVIKNPVTGDPTATVVAGALGAGFTTWFTMSPVDFVQGMINAGAGKYFDALSFHPYQESLPFSQGYAYPGLGTPLEQLDAMKKVIGPTKSLWLTEYGLSTSRVSEQQQAAYIQDLLDYWQSYGQAGPVFVYTTRDAQTGSSNPEDAFGVWRTDGTPKPAAQTLLNWTAAHPQASVAMTSGIR
jgi:hypothetical protein